MGGGDGMQTYRYNPAAGILYAQSYALYDGLPEDLRLFYYSEGDDCTNFISQCVWAAYGGWLPGYTQAAVSENRARILRDVRQVKSIWFGSASHVGSLKWCRVEDFYSYATREKEQGPAARKIAEGDFASVDPSALLPGDVVQLVVTTYTPDRYGHGLYVTRAGATWDDVLICCHTYNRLNEPMTQFAQAPQIYPTLRVLRFSPAAFVS